MSQPQDTAKREPNDELNLSHLKDFRAVLRWSYNHGLLKGEFPDADSSDKSYLLDEGMKRVNQLIQQDREQYAYEYARKIVGSQVEEGSYTTEPIERMKQQEARAVNSHIIEQHNRNNQLRGKME